MRVVKLKQARTHDIDGQWADQLERSAHKLEQKQSLALGLLFVGIATTWLVPAAWAAGAFLLATIAALLVLNSR